MVLLEPNSEYGKSAQICLSNLVIMANGDLSRSPKFAKQICGDILSTNDGRRIELGLPHKM